MLTPDVNLAVEGSVQWGHADTQVSCACGLDGLRQIAVVANVKKYGSYWTS